MKHKEVWAFIVLMLFLPGFSVYGESAGREYILRDNGKFVPEISDLNVTSHHTTLPGPEYCVNGNITVENGGELILEGQKIYINSSHSQRYSIIVMEGGRLIVRNSSIQSFSSVGYFFEVRGWLEIFNSTILDIDFPGQIEKSGIQILSGNASISLSVIRGKGMGIYVDDSELNITDSIVEGGTGAVVGYNSSLMNIMNTTMFTAMNSGIGVYSENSKLNVRNSTIENNSIGAGITNTTAFFINTSIENNTIGLYVVKNNQHVPIISNCYFLRNHVAGAYVHDNAEFWNTTFQENGMEMPFEKIGGLVIDGTGMEVMKVNITASTFVYNRRGIVSYGSSLKIKDTLFRENRWFNGTAGVLIRAEGNESVSIQNCNFTENPTGMDIRINNATAQVTNTVFRKNEAGIRIEGETLILTGNDFLDNLCGIEEHESRSTQESGNSFTNNTVDYRYIKEMRFLVKDGYGIPLSGAEITLRPQDEGINFSLVFRTDSEGMAIGDVTVMEKAPYTHSYFPYHFSLRFRDIVVNDTVSEENTTVEITVPFQRPELRVGGLKVKNHGFSLIDDCPRVDEESVIMFHVENIGRGVASNTTVMVLIEDRIIAIKSISLEPGEKKEFSVKWTPEHEGKTNISVKVYDPDEPDPTAAGPVKGIEVSKNEKGYFYAVILFSLLAILLMAWWIISNIEGADEVMAEFTKRLRLRFAEILETIAQKLRVQEREYVASESKVEFIPTGDIRAWSGASLSGTGKFSPWSMEDVRRGREKAKDVITVTIKIPPPEPEVEEEPDVEVFEWVSKKGAKEKIKVDKKTLEKYTHPRLFICSKCDHSFVSTDRNAKCPWCGGHAILLKNL